MLLHLLYVLCLPVAFEVAYLYTYFTKDKLASMSRVLAVSQNKSTTFMFLLEGWRVNFLQLLYSLFGLIVQFISCSMHLL